jgi:hypothetical protein
MKGYKTRSVFMSKHVYLVDESQNSHKSTRVPLRSVSMRPAVPVQLGSELRSPKRAHRNHSTTRSLSPPIPLTPCLPPLPLRRSAAVSSPAHGTRLRPRGFRRRLPLRPRRGDDSSGHAPRVRRGAAHLRLLCGGGLLRPGAGEPGAQGVERAGAAAAQ